jgi:hypothetical protein
MPLSWKERAHYVLEIQELAGSLLRRLGEIEGVSRRWAQHVDCAEAQLANEATIDVQEFQRTMRAQVVVQTEFFDLVEAFFAGWARLSLLLFPAVKGPGATFRTDRGQTLRQALSIADDSVFSDREFRDAWMHFDERLDAAVQKGTLGNRQCFVQSAQAKARIPTTLRLMEVDTSVVWYRSRDGESKSHDLKSTRTALEQLHARAASWFTG